ncbi:50S ribosomal protein L4 [Mycena indigotica]|uniref:Large ribosomal subunit protein uL4m n=1 Tax=Mycena indigotica TaxID=2126181 RepID=A0A8H6SWY5_9AGAR|nr:50S ribosomal protein L4 [Mycena indigotica]KAF7306874.1 50S ribosomal protein L4 [Mycena indigotica]
MLRRQLVRHASTNVVGQSPVPTPLCLSLTTPFKCRKGDPDAVKDVVVLDPTVFGHPIRRDILHLCVTHYRDSLRQGSANTKTRSERSGTGRKPFNQKGGGVARAGDLRSPLHHGGGVAFGPKPRDFSTELPRKVLQMGMRVALSLKVKESLLGVMSSMDWPNGKTKHLAQKIDALGLRRTLFVTGEQAPVGLDRAIRNIPLTQLTTLDQLTVYDILKWPRVILDLKAVDLIEQTLRKQVPISQSHSSDLSPSLELTS